MFTLPEMFRSWYPNPVQTVGETPMVLFRDHRWTLPLVALAAEQGLIALPATLVSFDRHRDALEPVNGIEPLVNHCRGARNLRELIELVCVQLSPRDDDWVTAGMELGLIGDTIQFSSNPDMNAHEEPVAEYTDGVGSAHRMFRLGRPHVELSFKGALADPESRPAQRGLWERSGWNPAGHRFSAPYLLDFDLDYWTISWDTYTFPFPEAVFEGEFTAACQSPYAPSFPVSRFFGDLIRGTPLVTVAMEPDFCGGVENARATLAALNRYFFGGMPGLNRLKIDESDYL